jgi:hypothetical protein
MRGISTIISAVILLALALTLSLITSDFISKTSKDRTEQIRDISKERLDCEFASLYIRNASLDCSSCASGSSIAVTIVNSGRKAVDIDTIYVRNTTGTLLAFGVNGTRRLNATDVATFTNTSPVSCGPMNRTIERFIVSSLNCPSTAFDFYPAKDVVYLNCGGSS